MKNCNLRVLLLILILVFLSLACQFNAKPAPIAINPANQPPSANSQANQPASANNPPNKSPTATNSINQQAKPTSFTAADCNVNGVTFIDISADYIVDDIYDGPYLSCNVSSSGSHGLSETTYFRIVAYKVSPLKEYYQDLQSNIQGFVDQANAWNAQSDIPESAKDTITFIRNDSEGYIFLITKEANVQGCIMGDGYGAEIINGKYLVQLQFSSCEGDGGTYLAAMQDLKTAAEAAITRLEANAQP